MRLNRSLYMLIFSLFLSAGMWAQEIYEDINVYQGTDLEIKLTSNYGTPILKTAPIEGNDLELIAINSNEYTFLYTPDAEFLGDDGFSLEVIESLSPPTKVTHIFEIHVITSMIESEEDFVRISSLDPVMIYPLANDDASSDNLEIKIAQVANGNAIAVDDSTILYTPASLDNDFILYSVIDEYGVSSVSTIYITSEDGSGFASYNVPSGSSEYVILGDSTYSLSNDSLLYGTLEQVNPFAFKYTADVNIGGQENLTFTDSEGGEHVVEVNVYEKYTDLGYVRDDVFFTAQNTQLMFDVTSNDLNDQYVISDFSEELTHIGDGIFVYTPQEGFSGIKTFSYTADNGLEEQSGSIEIVVNNYKPENALTYNFNAAKNKPRVIEYSVPNGTEYLEIHSYPMHGDLDVYGENESVNLECLEGIQRVFAVYTPDDGYVGLDNFTLRYCASDNNLCDDVLVEMSIEDVTSSECICVDDCVWPGDANRDGKVSVLDVLSIGRFMGLAGSARQASGYGDAYEGTTVEDWSVTLLNGTNAKHADANGDGLISEDDLQVILDNYGNINTVISNDVFGASGVPLYFTSSVTEIDSGQLLTIEVNLGTVNNPAIDLNGFSFGVNINPAFVDSSTVELVYNDSGFFTQNSPYVSLYNQVSDGKIHSAATKTNNLSGTTGYGVIATLSFIVEEEAEGFKDETRSRALDLNGDKVIRIEASDIIVESSNGRKMRLADSYIDIPLIDKSSTSGQQELILYPNPTNQSIKLNSVSDLENASIRILDQMGKVVLTKTMNNSNESIDVSALSIGLYFLELESNGDIQVEKFVRQ